MEFLGGPMDRAAVEAQIDRHRGHWAEHGYGVFAVDQSGGEGGPDLLGFTGLKLWPEWAEVEVGWRLARAAWGQGLATEAATVVLDWAFATLDLASITSVIAPRNARSRAVAERLGMQVIREDIAAPHDVPVVVYAIDAERWAAR
jgi:RimJ/RimL family protein N-acetyltransferase